MIDLLPIGSLLLKMALAAAVVVAASVTAERAGPLLGGIVISLPVSAGPGYAMLALRADDDFVSESALFSLAAQAATVAFMVAFARAAPHTRPPVSLAVATLAWLVAIIGLREAALPWWGALLVDAVAFALAFRLVGKPVWPDGIGTVRPSRRDLAARALLTGMLVAVVVGASEAIGPAYTGMALVYPVVLTTTGWILHRRYGGAAAGAMIAASLKPMIGFVGFIAAIHLAAVPLGSMAAILCGLVATIAWSLLLIALSRRGRNQA